MAAAFYSATILYIFIVQGYSLCLSVCLILTGLYSLNNFHRGDLTAILAGVWSTSVHFLESGSSKLPDSVTVSLTPEGFLDANRYMLGMSAEAPTTWNSVGDVLSRPRFIALCKFFLDRQFLFVFV